MSNMFSAFAAKVLLFNKLDSALPKKSFKNLSIKSFKNLCLLSFWLSFFVSSQLFLIDFNFNF